MVGEEITELHRNLRGIDLAMNHANIKLTTGGLSELEKMPFMPTMKY